MNNEITKDEMKEVLKQKIIAYKQAYYSNKVDAQIAGDIDDERMKKTATDNMARVQKLIDAIEKMTAEIGDS